MRPRVVANASHELRTPLARQRTVAQVALADHGATVESLRAAHQRALAAGVQQEPLIDALLAFSGVQAGLDRRDPFDRATVRRRPRPVMPARRASGRPPGGQPFA
jgi:signal transduction histidine kinase